MTNTITHEGNDFQFSKKTGLYLPKDLRKQVDPTLAEKTWQNARRPIIYGLTALTLGGAVAPTIARADNISIENTLKGEDHQNPEFSRTRTKLSTDAMTFTYDHNKGEDSDEAKLWINALSKNGWYLGVLAEGQTDNGADSYADIGACVSKTIGNKTYEAFIGPTVQPGVKPCMFYQFAVRNTDGKGNLVLALVDDKTLPFKVSEMDFRPYITGQIGDFFGGIGTRQKGFDVTRWYGSAGLLNDNIGAIGVFDSKVEDKETFAKVMFGLGDPSGAFGIGTSNLWNDMKGPGMRDMSVPYFTSFLTKGDKTGKLELCTDPTSTDIEAMAGANFGIARIGAGVNYHNEDGKTNYGGLIHVVKSIGLGELGNLTAEGRYNSRTGDSRIYTKISKSF